MDKFTGAVATLLSVLLCLDSLVDKVQAQQRPRISEHPADVIATTEDPLIINCKASGRPKPEIFWYHNGTPLATSERRVILPEGSLFFLRVVQNKREQDGGVYWCEAKSSAGSAISRNATLQIAVLRDDFRSMPKDTIALVGGPVVMNCTPPRGIPEPSVLWYKNEKLLDLSGKRLSMVDLGSLMISEVQASDAGKYLCSAQSMAGTKTAPEAELKVLAPPTVVKGPQDTEVIEGEGLDLPCELTGDPKPIVAWYRHHGQLPEGRSRVLLDNTLRIEDARAEDQGRYICRGHNEGGNVSVAVELFVYATPTFMEAPSDVHIKEGGTLRLPCRAQGRPIVRTVWDRVDRLLPPVAASQPHIVDTMSPLHDHQLPNLNFRTKRHENETLTVTDRTRRDKRDLHVRPTVATSDSVVVHQMVPEMFVEDPVRRRQSQETANNNFVLAEFRQIMRDQDDASDYDELQFRQRRKRDVQQQQQQQDVGHGEEVLASPAAITAVAAVAVPEAATATVTADDGDSDDSDNDDEDSGVGGDNGHAETDGGGGELTDKMASSDAAATPILFFSTPATVDFMGLDVSANGELTLKDVAKKDQGWYACAALNEAGAIVKRVFVRVIGVDEQPDNAATTAQQLPSDLSTSSVTLGGGGTAAAAGAANRWAIDQNIIINSVTATLTHSLDIAWETADGLTAKTLTLHYRVAGGGSGGGSGGGGRDSFATTAAVAVPTKEHRIVDLRAHTEYEVFATIPGGLSGSVSNIRKGMTMDGAPTAPPADVRVGVINNTAAYVRWSPPPHHLLHGELTGYKIQIKSNSTNKLLGQMSLNATTLSVVINSLQPGGRYIARVASLTAGGLGPFSQPAALHMDPSFIVRPPRTDPAANGWAGTWMPGIALGIFGVCLVGGAIFAIIWARRNKQNMKASYPGPTITASIPDKHHALWLHGNSLIKPTHTLAPPPPMSAEYAEVAQSIIGGIGIGSGGPQLINAVSAPPEPYATVTLQRGSGAQSDDSCVKCSASPCSSEYNAMLMAPGGAVMQREPPLPLNLCDVLPPPPDHPYGAYKPPINMTIRTNPAAMSPQIMRRVPPTPPRWGQTMPTPPIPNFPQNWMPQRRMHMADGGGGVTEHDMYGSENDYESGSVLYEQCCRGGDGAAATMDDDREYFSRGEPTEEYYRNVNMEFFEDQQFEPSTPPPPCPDSYAKLNPNLRLIADHSMDGGGGGHHHQHHQQQQQQHHHHQHHQHHQQQQQQQQQMMSAGQNMLATNKRLARNPNAAMAAMAAMNMNMNVGPMKQQTMNVNNGVASGINSGLGGGGGGSGGGGGGNSSDSESDNRWAPRSRRSRSRSKSGDRKYRTGGHVVR